MQRYDNWPTRLNEYECNNRDTAFKWGVFDCCLAAAGAVEAMTGKNPCWKFEGKYKTLRGALSTIKRYCGEASLLVALESLAKGCGALEVIPLKAQRGDVMLCVSEEFKSFGGALGWVNLVGTHVMVPSEDGLVPTPVNLGLKAWRFG